MRDRNLSWERRAAQGQAMEIPEEGAPGWGSDAKADSAGALSASGPSAQGPSSGVSGGGAEVREAIQTPARPWYSL